MKLVAKRRCRSTLERFRVHVPTAPPAILALCLVASSACSKPTEPGSSGAAPVSEGEARGAQAAGAGGGSHSGLTWFEDDLDGAASAAVARGRPIFVELWAPWCHTCLSMKSFVLTRENVPALTEVVPLAINTEKAENAPFLESFPVGVWPTFYVIAPPRDVPAAAASPSAAARLDKDDVVGRWLGGASAGQVQRFLSESSRAAELLRADARSADDPLHQLATADRLATSGQHGAAAAAYAKALTVAPPDWPRRPETLVAQITALSKAKAYGECLTLGSQGMDQTGQSASAVDFIHYALDCAEREESPLSPATRTRAERRLDVLCREGSPELSPDDRADACSALSDVRTALGERDGAHQALLTRLAVLEQAAVGKPTSVALAYDWARTDVLIALDRAAEALPFLIEHEHAAPANYNPPQQQARCYKALARWEEGLAAIERALALAYGPRRAGFLTLKADLLLGAGRNAEARAVVEEQLLAYRALPPGQRQPAAEERVSQRLANWNGASVR